MRSKISKDPLNVSKSNEFQIMFSLFKECRVRKCLVMIQELFDVLLPFACFAFCLVSNQITNTHRDTELHETRQLLLPSLLHSDGW